MSTDGIIEQPYHPERRQLPIAEHGVIAAALVGVNGSIDFLCMPHFDSPSIFASLLDSNIGGFFQITPFDPQIQCKQFYWPDTNILVTRFLSEEGVAQVIDFMPVKATLTDGWRNCVIRLVEGIRGDLMMKLQCYPAFDYARAKHKMEINHERQTVTFTSNNTKLLLLCKTQNSKPKLSFSTQLWSGVESNFLLTETCKLVFELRYVEGDNDNYNFEYSDYVSLFYANVYYWKTWLSQCTYRGQWQEMVHRSALALKLHTFEETGAIISSPSFGLPSVIGGSSNWDYRYTWVRDSSYVIYALLQIGLKDEAVRYAKFLGERAREVEPQWMENPRSVYDGVPMQPIYGIKGEHELSEIELTHLRGYQNSRPVRIGNASYRKLQLDIFGEIMDALYVYNQWANPLSHDAWQYILELIDWVCCNWCRQDYSIWDSDKPHHYVYSKIMCWVAIDRAIRLSENRPFPLLARREMRPSPQTESENTQQGSQPPLAGGEVDCANTPRRTYAHACSSKRRKRWYAARDEIFMDVMERGWNKEIGAFVQTYEGKSLDSSLTMIPLVRFLAPNDPRVLQTIDKIALPQQRGGLSSGGLVYRFNSESDAISSEHGTFNAATFWLIEALARAGGERAEHARLLFENMLTFANHLGLYSEEVDSSGNMLGNFPHAFTHLSLICAACTLSPECVKRSDKQ